MVSDEQYQTAIEGLKAGVARPGALSPDEMTRLSDMVEEYRARRAPAKDTRAPLPDDTRLAIQDVVGKYPGVTEGGFRTMLEKESGINPRARNSKSGAAGVFQLMPDQQKGLVPGGDITKLSAADQIRLYPKYLQSHGVTPTSDADVALAQAAPAMVGKRDEVLVYPKGSPAAEQNKPWQDAAGNVTVGSIKAFYKSQGQPAPTDYGEHSSLGPTGMDVLEKNIPVAPEARPVGKYQLPPLTVAEPKLNDYPGTAPGVAAFEQAKAAWLAQHHEGGPRSAEGQSATNRLDVPGPEYRPPKAPDTSGPLLMAHPLDAAMAIGEKLNRARAELPTGLGGDVEHVYEPSEAEFRRVMGPVYGAKVAQLDKHSPEYKEYADAKWAAIVARAEQQGVPVVRSDYAKNQGLAGKAQYGLDAAGAAVAGFDQGLTGGILGAISDKAGSAMSSKQPLNPEASVREELIGAFPISKTVGEIGGILNPKGVAGKAGGLAERGIAAVLGNPARWFSKLGVGAIKGAAGAAVGTAALDAGQDVAAGISGRDGIPLSDEPGRIGIGAGLGAPLGMLGAGMRIHGERLRESTPLGNAGDLVKTSVLSGAKPTSEGADLLARAQAEGVSPESLLSNDIERPLSQTALAEREALVRKIGDANQAGYRAHAGKEASYQPVLTAVQDALKEVKDLPFGEQFARPLEKALPHIAEPVPAGNAGEYTAAELRRMGFNVSETMRDVGMPEEMADMIKFDIEPKTATPEATDMLVRIIGKAQDANPGGLHQYDKIERAAKAMQDQFGAAWTAAKKGAGQEFADLQRQHELAGLRGKLDERGLTADQYKAFLGQLRNYGKESTVAENEAVRRLAGAAGKSSELERIPQARSMGEIMDQARLGASIRFRGGSLFPSGALSATPLRLRVDPIFRYVGPNLGSLGLLGPREGGDDIDQISSILNRQTP